MDKQPLHRKFRCFVYAVVGVFGGLGGEIVTTIFLLHVPFAKNDTGTHKNVTHKKRPRCYPCQNNKPILITLSLKF